MSPSELHGVLRGVEALLLDFDGPICSVFAGYPAPQVADELRRLAVSRGATLTDELQAATSPHQVLRLAANAGYLALTRAVADALRDTEIAAVATATPAAGITDVMQAARNSGRRVAIVSNNAAEAVHAYLDRHNLAADVDNVSARYHDLDPRLLKPSDHLVRFALTALHTPPTSAVLVGDTTDDMEAGRAAGVRTIGYANKPGKRERLAAAGADVVIDTMGELATALRATPAAT